MKKLHSLRHEVIEMILDEHLAFMFCLFTLFLGTFLSSCSTGEYGSLDDWDMYTASEEQAIIEGDAILQSYDVRRAKIAPDKLAKKLEDSIALGTWDGTEHFIEVREENLWIRHTTSVHIEIEKFLLELDEKNKRPVSSFSAQPDSQL